MCKTSVLMPLTSDVEMKIQLLMGAFMRHFATKRDIIVLSGSVKGEVAHSCVIPIWSQLTFHLMGGLDNLAPSGPGKRDRRRVEAISMALQRGLFF